MITVSEIGKKVFDGLAKSIDGVIHQGSVWAQVEGPFDSATGQYTKREMQHSDCRFIVGGQKEAKNLGNYILQPDELVLMVEGLTIDPTVGMMLKYIDAGGVKFDNQVGLIDDRVENFDVNTKTKAIRYVEDIAGAGGLYFMVVK